MTQHKVFISYHHDNDQYYKDELLRFNGRHNIFIDRSLHTGKINDSLPNDKIRTIIRDDYLRDSTVTIVLVGIETRNRKFVDWEIYSSMYDGAKNKKSGILAIYLPSTNSGLEYLPDRITENVSNNPILVIPWEQIVNEAQPNNLKFCIESVHDNRSSCNYDLSRPMRRHNS